MIESTAIGAAYLAGYGSGLWSIDEINQKRKINQVLKFKEVASGERIKSKRWNEAVKRTLNWIEP